MATSLSIALLAVSVPLEAAAWQPIAAGSPTWQPPVPYSLNERGSDDLGGFSATETEVRRGMDDWSRVSCTGLTTAYRGQTSATPGSYEGVSTIGWIESGWRHSGSAIGVTGPRWGSYIIEADMEMNGVNFRWTTGSGSFDNVNTYSIVLHEGGHYYGLGHTNVRGSSMWPSYSGGVVGLGPDDENGICALYPGGTSDCTTTGCPSGQECVDGSCQTITGDGTVCSPCDESADCGAPSDLCLGYPDGTYNCGKSCRSDADCPDSSCVALSAGAQCVRFSGSTPSCAESNPGGCSRDSDCGADQLCDAGTCVARPTSGNDLGAGCTGDSECRSGLCIGGLCTQSCDWLDPQGSCPSGFYCDGDVSTSCSTGYCVRGTAGAGGLGAPCGSDTDCSSLHCDGGVCSQPCIPGGAAGCPSGYACQVGTLPCRGSCRRAGTLGDECEANDDCTSQICAERGDISFCTELCNESSPCPDRFSCVPAGDSSVCAPDSGGLGADCDGNEECLSNICAEQGDRSYCTRVCDDTTPCPPSGYVCSPTSDPDTRVCEPVVMMSDDGCGCAAVGSGSRSAGGWLLVALAGLGVVLRRRRG